MLLTIVGLAITTATSIVGVIVGRHHNYIRIPLLVLAVSGFGVAVYASYRERAAKETARAEAREQASMLGRANQQLHEQASMLKRANQQLDDLRGVLNLVNLTVGNLGSLNELSGGAKYRVRIAADTSRERLKPFLSRLEAEFKGARTSGLVDIREPSGRSKNYELVFGQGLDLAAAEVFQRLAMSHHLPPPQQVAAIEPESAPNAEALEASTRTSR
jgi:hypothetical protein